MKKRALIIVDVQNDFLPDHRLPGDEWPAPTLPVPNGLSVIRPLTMEAESADLVVATMDWHPATHPSFKEVGGIWPMHCVQGTKGAELTPEIDYAADFIVRKGMGDGDGYSGFEDTRLNNLLQWHRNDQMCDFEEIIVGGLATNYCVYHTAVDAKRYWPDTRVVVLSDASQGIWTEMDTEEKLIADLTEEGVEYLPRAQV